MKTALSALIITACAAFVFGELVGIKIIKLNKWKLTPLAYLKLGFFFGIIYSVWGLFCGAIIGILGILADSLFNLPDDKLTYSYIILSLLSVTYFVLKWTNLKSELFRVVISFAIASFAFLSLLAASRFYKPSLFNGLLMCSSLSLPVLGAGLFEAVKRKESSSSVDSPSLRRETLLKEPYDAETKVLLIGLDAADWHIMQPLINQGKLPNIARLRDNGFYASLKSITPTNSAMIWTSVMTGKTYLEHGIVHWQKTIFPGLAPIPGEPLNTLCPKGSGALEIIRQLLRHGVIKASPYTSQSRKCKALWNILSDWHKKSATIGWFFSWPAEVVNGINVSWYTYPFEEVSNEYLQFSSSNLRYRTYPEEFIKGIEHLIVTQKDISHQELKKLNLPTVKIDYGKRRFADKISPWYLAKDKTFFNIARFILGKYTDLNLVSVYFGGLDVTSHAYWPFLGEAQNNQKHKNQILSISDDNSFRQDSKGFGRCIELYYQYMDEAIGGLLQKVNDNWTTIVVSDHGFRYDGSEHFQGPDGIFIACGKNIEKSKKMGEVSFYDAAPTILYLLGMPVASDFEGRVIKEAIKDDFQKRFPIQSITTYETARAKNRADDVRTPQEVEEALQRRLRALGYID